MFNKEQRLSGGLAGGSEGFNRFVENKVRIGTENFNLDKEVAEALTHRYGGNVEKVYNYLMEDNQTGLDDMTYAMLRYGLEEEMVIHPIDFLLRRSSMMLFNIEKCLEIKDAVIDYMADYYEWTEEVKETITKEVEEEIQRHTVYGY